MQLSDARPTFFLNGNFIVNVLVDEVTKNLLWVPVVVIPSRFILLRHGYVGLILP